jgi:putative membrane protein insertion efficiency factor
VRHLALVVRVFFPSPGVAGAPTCKYYPSCSQYAEEAIRVHGAVKGSVLVVWRIARCGPFTEGGIDHVPPRRAHSYDAVVLREALP